MDVCTIIVYAYSILLVVSEDSFKPKMKKDQEIKKLLYNYSFQCSLLNHDRFIL